MRKIKRFASGFLAAVLLCVFLCPFFGMPEAMAEEENGGYRFIAPSLPSDADPYDPEKPEELSPDQLYAKSAILIEASTGEVIFEKNADQIMFPASTTKIMTVLLGIMMGDLNQEVVASEWAVDLDDGDSKIGLEAGETIIFRDLLYATMVKSGNDGARIIAETISGSEDGFAELMNQAAAMYGCTNTHFVNASGLTDPQHYTTARDMAMIARAAMQNDTFRSIAGTYSYSLPRSNLSRPTVLTGVNSSWLNPNQEETENYTSTFYPYATGIKTGFTQAAGYCYVGSAERDGVELISVVFYTTNGGRWSDSKKLMEYGFTQFVSVTPQELYNQNPVILGTTGFSLEDTNVGRLQLNAVPQASTRTVHIIGTKTEMENMARNLRQTVVIEYSRESFAAPIEQGELFGTMTYYPADGGSPVVYDLVASRSIARRENAPLTLEEIEAEVRADKSLLPPLSVELVLFLLVPVVAIALPIVLFRLLFRKKTKRKHSRIPKPRNRYFR